MLANVVVPVNGDYELGFGGIGPYSLDLDGEIDPGERTQRRRRRPTIWTRPYGPSKR